MQKVALQLNLHLIRETFSNLRFQHLIFLHHKLKISNLFHHLVIRHKLEQGRCNFKLALIFSRSEEIETVFHRINFRTLNISELPLVYIRKIICNQGALFHLLNYRIALHKAIIADREPQTSTSRMNIRV